MACLLVVDLVAGLTGCGNGLRSRRLLERKRRRQGRGQDEAWLQLHQKLVGEVEAADKASTGFDVVFYGDSIIESTRCAPIGEVALPNNKTQHP
jgi:hypothetical protein